MDPDSFADPDFRLWLSLHLPAVRLVDEVEADESGCRRTGVIVHTNMHRAEARFQTAAGGLLDVTQDFRRLFDHVGAAWREWQRQGCPGRRRIGITARVDGTQTAWLDAPTSGVSWPLRAD